jgi:hypothetical protein
MGIATLGFVPSIFSGAVFFAPSKLFMLDKRVPSSSIEIGLAGDSSDLGLVEPSIEKFAAAEIE